MKLEAVGPTNQFGPTFVVICTKRGTLMRFVVQRW
jgi:hypothetical protein